MVCGEDNKADNEKVCARGGVEDVGRQEGMYSRNWVMTWVNGSSRSDRENRIFKFWGLEY